ncbi:MAG: hypothetical protein LBH47_00165 [Christensenellaceae bacterium]|jgi:hypothetical protein|nr:hypothetical protein [Christensenellaceae bacterium]
MDFVALSNKKPFKISIIASLILGTILIAVSMIILGQKVEKVFPNALNVSMSNIIKKQQNIYEKEIRVDEYIFIDAKTKNPLIEPITFTLDSNASQFIQPIAPLFYSGWTKIRIKNNNTANRTQGILTIQCASYSVEIRLIYITE